MNGSTSVSYRVRIDAYQGPFDLLLSLVSRQKIDIGAISIADITDQYLAEVERMKDLDLDIASDFLVVAATLLQIKASSLLPKEVVEPIELDDELANLTPEQTRDILVERLVVYKQFKNVAAALGARMENEAKMHPRLVGPDERFLGLMPDYLKDVTLHGLAVICADIAARRDTFLLEAEHMDLDVAGDFIAMAAQLVYIKSRMLLPKHEEDEDGEDPRAGLVEMLLEYQRLKSATAFFAEKNETGRDIYVKPPERQNDAPVEYHHTVNDLIRAANKMLRRTKRRLPPPVTSFQGIVGREPAPVEGRVTAILKRFLYRMRVPFMRLFDDARNRSEIVATFLAVLELSKTRRIRLEGDGEEMELMLTNDNTK